MRIFFLCAYLSLAGFPSYGQFKDDKQLYDEKVKKFVRMKTAGMVLSIAGSVAMMLAVTQISNEDYSLYSSTSDEEDYYIATTAVAAASMLGAGVPLWIIGARKQRKYNQRLNNLSVGAKINSNQRGLALRYRF
jgi:hypothetical protein